MRRNIRSERDLYNWLFEQEEAEAEQGPDPLTAEKIQKLWAMPYAQFVAELPKMIQDKKVRAFLMAGRKDGDETDESVKTSNANVKGSALFPTQSEIDLGKSVGYAFANTDAVAGFYKGGAWKGGDPIIIAGGKFVIDGHHRWSQATAFNPDITLSCINIDVPDPVMALKMTQAAIAMKTGNVPSQKVDPGMNVLAMAPEQIVAKFVSPGSAMMPTTIVPLLQGKMVVTADPAAVEATKKTVQAAGGLVNILKAGAEKAAKEKSKAAQGGRQTANDAAAETGKFGITGGQTMDRGDAMGGAFLTEAFVGEGGGDELTKYSEAASSLALNLTKLNQPQSETFSRNIMPQTGKDDGGPGPEGLKAAFNSGDMNYKPGYDISGGGGAEVQKESLNENRIRRIHLPGIHRSRS